MFNKAIVLTAITVFMFSANGQLGWASQLASQNHGDRLDEIAVEHMYAATEYVQTNFNSKPGVLGGTIRYNIVESIYSPDKKHLAFLISGEDGHIVSETVLCVLNLDLGNVKQIAELQDDYLPFHWSDNQEITYIKDQQTYKVTIE